MPQAGWILGDRFEVRDFLDGGGMGVVYRGLDRATGKPVLIKTLRRGCTRLELLHFIREASLDLGDHPCLPRIVARFVHQRRVYLVREPIEGRPLQDILVARHEWQSPLHESERNWFNPWTGVEIAVRCMARTARVVDWLHGQGLVHRDLKPANLIWSHHHRPVVIDFGLARQRLTGRITPAGQAAGTPPYMAPEQRRCDDVDARADTYSLGATLWHLLTGSPAVEMPHRGKLWGRDEWVPDYLLAVVQKAMEWSPARRFQRAADFADALEGWLGDREEADDLARPATRLRRWAWRHQLGLAMIGAVSFLVALVATTLLFD